MKDINDQDHVKGVAEGRFALIEYGDYQCPYCAQAYPILESILERTKGKVLFSFRHFPLTKMHPFALAAAQTAEAAGLQGQFWEMHKLLLENQDLFRESTPTEFAHKLGLYIGQFESDFKSDFVINKIQTDFKLGVKDGVSGTPSFFVNGKSFAGDWARGGLTELLHAAPH